MKNASLSLSNPAPMMTSTGQKIALAVAGLGILGLLITWAAGEAIAPALVLSISFALIAVGTGLFIRSEYLHRPEGIRNNGVWFRSLTARGVWAWLAGIIITGFYVCLYWFPKYLTGLIELFTPLSMLLRAKAADQWFVYGSLYTLAVLVLGIKFMYKYQHNRYQLIRTISVTFFQLGFAWLIPGILVRLQQPELYFTYFWPLSYYHGTPSAYAGHSTTSLGTIFFYFGLFMFFVGTPVLTYFFGKRWYCSWVCGCGGLAETAGDPFRQLSDKSLRAWKIERWMIYTVLGMVVTMTALLWINVATDKAVFYSFSQSYYKTYGFLIGSAFSGVVGVGFYPLLGSRVWCRFGCPMAAWLGFWQKKKSKFRITTNGNQCISCGNCSTYCEMGIDVRAYAQRGQDIVRASCVGCGICSAVCPRGVLRLENSGSDVAERAEQVRNEVVEK
ncbi:MAG: 4Fe-4S binding protein [Saprospiraceae bacterium]